MNFKFTKENTQRLLLAGLALVILLVFFQTFLLGPAFNTIRSSASQIEKVSTEMSKAKSLKTRIENMQRQVDQASELEKTLFMNQPAGDPIAWFPPRIENFFKKAGIQHCLATLSSPSDEEIPGLRTYRCTVEFPEVSFMRFGVALAAFENHDTLLEVRNVSISAQSDNPALQTVTLGLRIILKP
jgi:hypothetical protein